MDSDDIRERRRRLGAQLATFRRAERWTQDQLARTLDYARTSISHIEAGTQPAPKSFWRQVDELLQADKALLSTFNELEDARAQQNQAIKKREHTVQKDLARQLRGAAPDGTTEQDGDSAVLRRDFMRLSAGVAGFAASSLETGWQSDTATSLTSGRRINSNAINQMRERMARLRQLDNHLGGADTYQLYAHEVAATQHLLKEASCAGTVKRELLALYAEQAQQAGWAAFDAGWDSDARNLYERSLEAAKEAKNAALVGNALAHRAYQLVSSGQPAVDLAKASCQVAEEHSAHPTVRALLQERSAWTYAVASQPDRVAQALALAEDALDQDSEQSGPDWAAWVDHTELKIMTGRCWTELQRPLRAVPALEEALNDYSADSHARDWSLYAAALADAYVDAGEIEQAADVTKRALELSTDVASVRPRQRLAAVASRLETYRSTSDVLAGGSVDPVDIRPQAM